MKNQIILPDTNVILRYLLRDHEKMYEKANDFFERVHKGELRAIIMEGVLLEAIYVLTKFYKVPKAIAAEKLHAILSYRGIRNQDKSILLDALVMYSQKNIDFVDCILRVKAEEGLYDVFSFDKDVNKP